MKSYQERLRQKWIIPDRPTIKEIVFDIWPGLPMHMEVEAETEKDLMNFLSKLNINKDNIRYTSVAMFYEEILDFKSYKLNNKTPILNFASVESVLSSQVNNKDKFNEILDKQKNYLKRFGFESLKGGRNQSRIKPSKIYTYFIIYIL
jgi:hypothetical protein